jgi:CubicO group peptidase (beta-lactamase class C family)
MRPIHNGLHVGIGSVLFVAMASLMMAADPVYWPTQCWRESTPEQQGLDSKKLAEVFHHVKANATAVHSVLVIRNGYVVLDAVFYPYDRSNPHDIASGTKSITALLAGAAIGQHHIESVRDPISQYGMQSRQHAAEWSRVTVEDLLTMRSGVECEARSGEPSEMRESEDWVQFVLDQPLRSTPGSRFVYSSSSMHLLAGTVRASTRQSPLEFARSVLFQPLGIETVRWPADSSGVNHGWGDLHLLPRDMAKIGFLMLHDGRWENRQILPGEFVREAKRLQARTRKSSDYGYGWWVFDGERSGDFEAVGRGGQNISVLPRLNLIVVTTGGGFDQGKIGQLLLAAVGPNEPLPENKTALDELRALATRAELPPTVKAREVLFTDAQKRLAGVYTLTANPFSITKIGFDFSAQPTVINLHLGNGEIRSHIVGFDGRARFSPGGVVGLPVAVQGRWSGETRLMLEYDEVSSINHLTFDIEFSENSARFSVVDRTNPKSKIGFEGRRD